jgi:hypothetical protein
MGHKFGKTYSVHKKQSQDTCQTNKQVHTLLYPNTILQDATDILVLYRLDQEEHV